MRHTDSDGLRALARYKLCQAVTRVKEETDRAETQRDLLAAERARPRPTVVNAYGRRMTRATVPASIFFGAEAAENDLILARGRLALARQRLQMYDMAWTVREAKIT